MKYSDRERIEKMIAAAEKLLCYLRDKHITTDDICNDYAVQWTVTTPLYHIGEQFINCQMHVSSAILKCPGQELPD